MRANLLRYLREYGGVSFQEKPFCEVDALVLSQLSYLKMDGLVPGFGPQEAVSLRALAKHPDAEHLFSDPVFGPRYCRIFGILSKSVRYAEIRANYFSEWVEEDREVQFAAVTLLLGPTSVFVSYRGTDETLVGWKEDFNMGFMRSVPAQRIALSYLKGVARYTQGRIVIGGHSKGGNLAIFAAAGAPKSVQSRIRRVYSFDGPGFQKSFYEREGFVTVRERCCKIVPEQSLIGMLMNDFQESRIIASYGAGVAQHDLMNWKISGGRFVYLGRMRRHSSRKAEILNHWIDSLSKSQIRIFVDILYELLSSTRAKTVYELVKRPFRLLYAAARTFLRLDSGSQRSFWEIIGKLLEAVVHRSVAE